MTELDIVRAEQTALTTLDSAGDALARLADWVQAASHAHALVAPLVGTAFIPDAYKPKIDPRATPAQVAEARATAVANATAAVLQGITLGLDPMTALQQIYIVHGRPGMYARIKVALVQARGHEVWTDDLSDTRAVVAGRRKGTDAIERVTVTMDMARRAGWAQRNEQYQKNPQDMLWARAASRVCDRIAADALMGIASVEEVQDELAAPTAGGTRTVTPRRRPAAAAPALPAAPEPPLDDPVGYRRVQTPEGERIVYNHADAEPEPADEPVAETLPVEDPPLAEDEWPDTPQPPDAGPRRTKRTGGTNA